MHTNFWLIKWTLASSSFVFSNLSLRPSIILLKPNLLLLPASFLSAMMRRAIYTDVELTGDLGFSGSWGIPVAGRGNDFRGKRREERKAGTGWP